MAVKLFNYAQGDLALQILVDDAGHVTVNCVSGYADINALYWNDGNADGTSVDLGKSLNMNGSGEDWDGALKLSSSGLGQAVVPGLVTSDNGAAKDTYLTANQSLEFNIDLGAGGLDALVTLGIRATSTSTPEGSIKAVMTPHLEDVQVWDFEAPIIPTGELFIQTVPTDWTGSTVEIQPDYYGGHTGFADGQTQYLDTAASPGNVSLVSTTGDVGEGNLAEITIAVAPQKLFYPPNQTNYQTDPDAEFTLKFNEQTVHVFKLNEFDANNQEFQDFTFTTDKDGNPLLGVDGADSITISSEHEDGNYTGYSVDQIVLKEWIV